MTLYVLNYNNYYNRILKKFDTINKYADYVIYTLNGTNFNPNDGVNTTHVIGATVPYNGEGDYLLAVDEFNNIVSRWFIIDGARIRGGQYQLTLRRDLLADFKNEVLTSPCFIEKATPSVYDHAIYNSENMTFNQIKTAEYPIKDQTETPWVVAYINRSLAGDKEIAISPKPYYDYSATTLEDFEPYNKYKLNSTDCPEAFSKVTYHFHYFYSTGENVTFKRINYDTYFNLIDQDKKEEINTSFFTYSEATYSEQTTLGADLQSYRKSSDYITDFPSYVNLSALDTYDNKILRIYNGAEEKYYKIKKTYKTVTNEKRTVPDGKSSGALYNIFQVQNWISTGSNTAVGQRVGIDAHVDYTEYYLNFVDVTTQFVNTSVTISATRNQLSDAPYDMICTPLNKVTLGSTTYNEGELGLFLGQKIAQELTLGTGGNVFDIQLLPYCPLNGLEDIVDIGISNLTEHKDYDYVKEGNTVVSIVFYPNVSSFTNVIYVDVPSPLTTNPVEFKVHNECDKWRLCSPNYTSAFDFSLTKNEGLDYFEINCTYKPYNPYIHLNPNWGGLYGQDFNDARGLILQGDFSIAALNSAWEQYQLQNKNYEAVFNRQIQSMELKNNIQREQEAWQYVTGIVQGGAAGASTAALASGGNPYAAAAGAIVGTATSAIGGARDLYLNEQLRNEALDYSKDMYAYNLGNIQALPNSLSKSSAFDINNKVFPFLEYYTCGTVEKNALRDKLKYNGFTIMRIGKLENFVQNEESYMKGKLIRIEDTIEDYHIVNELGREVNLGFFIKGDN